MRRASSNPSASQWFKEVERTSSCRPSSRRGACAPRCAQAAWADVLAAIDALPASRRSKSRPGATGVRARWPRKTSDDEAKAIYAGLADDLQLLRPACRRGARPRCVAAPTLKTGSRGNRRRRPRRVRRACGCGTRRQARAARPAPRVGARVGLRDARHRRRRSAGRGRISRAAPDCTIARSTRRSGCRERHEFALRYLTPYETEFASAARDAGDRRGAAVRHRAPGVAVRRRHRVVGGRRGADAADAAVPRAGWRSSSNAPTTRRHASPTSTSTRSSARSTSSTGTTGSASLPGAGGRRLQCRSVAARRRGGRRHCRSKARSGSRRFRSTRRATT